MAGRGPAPKDPEDRVRRNKPNVTTIAGDGRLRGPALPDWMGEPWHPATLDWWANVRKSPQSRTWIPTDWNFLIDTALMHHTMWQKGRWDFAAEFRLRCAKYGLTPKDRQDMGIKIEEPAAKSPARGRSTVTDINTRLSQITG